MHRTEAQPRTARTLAAAATLAVLFVVAPAPLAGGGYGDFTGDGRLRGSVRGAFVDYWRSGAADLTPAMQRVADYWLRYHLAKAVIAALLLGVLAPLCVRLWRRYVRGAGHRVPLALAGTVVTAFALAALAVVMANLQGAAAPFASLLPMLVDTPPDATLAAVLSDVRQQLTAGATPSPALARMTDDYAWYHWVIAAIGTVVVAALLTCGVALWRRAAAATGPARRVLASYGVLSAAVGLVLAVVVAANIGTASNPGPGFLAFFEGGW